MKKLLAFSIIFLFIGMSVVSSTGNILKDVSVNNCSQELLSCDHLAYIGGYGSCWLYEFELDNPNNLTCTCSRGDNSNIISVGGTWSNDCVIIGCEYGNGVLWQIDPEICDTMAIGGGGTGVNGLAWDPVNNKLYGAGSTGLFEYDPDTGEQTYIGPYNVGTILMMGIACDDDGVLYGWDVSQNSLWTIDTETGQATIVGPLGIDSMYVRDGDFCKNDDILYIGAITTDPPYDSYLYECDEDTGNCTLVGQFPDNVVVDLFVIPWNFRPFTPSDPIPEDGATNVPVNVTLCWTGGDPDYNDWVTYDVYFGITNPPLQKSNNQTEPCYTPPYDLELCKKYYWQVVARDNHGAYKKGPIWCFTTPCPPHPPSTPIIDGPTNGNPGVEYSYTFVSTDQDDDDVSYYIDWYSAGEGFWTDFHAPGEEVILSHIWPKKGTFTINAKAKDVYGLESPWGTLEVTMPRDKMLHNSLYLWLFEHFQNAFLIFRFIF